MTQTQYYRKQAAAPAVNPNQPPPVDNRLTNGNLFVVEDKCSWNADRSRATVVIGCNNRDHPRAIEELTSRTVRDLAIAYAGTVGVGDARIDGIANHPYAINDEGVPLDQVRDADGKPIDNPGHIKMQVAGYQAIVGVRSKF